jgi:hypothetical protein
VDVVPVGRRVIFLETDGRLLVVTVNSKQDGMMELNYAALNLIMGIVLHVIAISEIILIPSFRFCGFAFPEPARLGS